MVCVLLGLAASARGADEPPADPPTKDGGHRDGMHGRLRIERLLDTWCVLTMALDRG